MERGVLKLTREVFGVSALGTRCGSGGGRFGVGGRFARSHARLGGILAHLNQGIK